MCHLASCGKKNIANWIYNLLIDFILIMHVCTWSMSSPFLGKKSWSASFSETFPLSYDFLFGQCHRKYHNASEFWDLLFMDKPS